MNRPCFAAVIAPSLLAALAVTATPVLADVVNGDFEAGNTGFSTDYAFRVVSDPPNFGQYGVTTSSFAWSQFWNTIPGDHTTGSGEFMIVDVGPDANHVIWSQQVAVNPGVQYTFSAWIANWTSFPSASLLISVNGSPIGQWGAPGTSWTQHMNEWASGANTSALITIRPASFFQPGDDVAIDDIHFTAVPTPGALGLLALGGVAAGRRRR